MRKSISLARAYSVHPIFTAAIVLAMAFTISCDAAGNPSALVGRWIGVSGEDKDAVMDLLSDGTGIFTKNSQGLKAH